MDIYIYDSKIHPGLLKNSKETSGSSATIASFFHRPSWSQQPHRQLDPVAQLNYQRSKVVRVTLEFGCKSVELGSGEHFF